MRIHLLFLLVGLVLLASACSSITPINDLTLPPVTTIEGTITDVNETGFMLEDLSGTIFIRVNLPDKKKLNVSLKDKVKVYGNLQGGQGKVFDAYVIEKTQGERIIVSNPTPHVGFVIQSSFQ